MIKIERPEISDDKVNFKIRGREDDEALTCAVHKVSELLKDLDKSKKKSGRPKTVNLDIIAKAIFYILITGCQLRMLPAEYGNWSNVKNYYYKLIKSNLIDKLMKEVVEEYTKMHPYKSNLQNQCIDSTMFKSLYGEENECVGKNPTDRGRNGTKISAITDGNGIVYSLTAYPANVSDMQTVEKSVNNMIVKRGYPSKMYTDKGYASAKIQQLLKQKNYVQKCHNKKNWKNKIYHNKRGEVINKIRNVIERTFGWVKKFRRLIVRYERHIDTFMGFLKLACIVITLRRIYKCHN